MTSRPHDPLDLLKRLPTPEPDEARMQATIAAARARFAEGEGIRPVPASRRRPRWAWAAAGVAAVATVAVLMPQSDAPQLAVSDHAAEPDRLAEALPAPVAEPPGRIMGARPPPAPPQADAELLPPAQRHDFDGFQIVERDVADGITLSFLRDGTETPFDRCSLDPGAGFELLDAFLLVPADAPELLLMRSRTGDATKWDVFTIGPDGIRLSGELSRRVHDAPDPAVAAERLSAPE